MPKIDDDQCGMPIQTNAFSTKMPQKESVEGSGRDIARGPEKICHGEGKRNEACERERRSNT